MTTYNTGNPLGSTDPRDLYDNAESLDEAVNSSEDTFQDRLGKSRLTWAGIMKAGSGDPAIAVYAAARANEAADRAEDAEAGVEQNAEQIAQDAAQQAVSSVIDGVDGQVAVAQSAADRAETAADIASTAGLIFPTSAEGQASSALTSGDYFWVESDSDADVLELWRKGATSATDTGKRSVNSSALYNSYSDLISGSAQSVSKPNLLPKEVYSCKGLPTIPAAAVGPSWPATITLFNAKPVLRFECDDASVYNASFQTELEPVETFADGVSSFSIVIEKSDVRVAALSSRIHFRGYTLNGDYNGQTVIVPFTDAGFSSSIVSTPIQIKVDNVDISSVLSGSFFVRAYVQLNLWTDSEIGDSVIVHSPCWVADDNSNFRINIADGLLVAEGDTW